MKLLVESPNQAPLIDTTVPQHIAGFRPAVVVDSGWVQTMIGERRLTCLFELGDEADDDLFALAYAADPKKAVADLPRPAKEPAKEPAKKA